MADPCGCICHVGFGFEPDTCSARGCCAAWRTGREEGRRAGIEEAAEACDRLANSDSDISHVECDPYTYAARCIRALAPPPPGVGDTTGNDGKRE